MQKPILTFTLAASLLLSLSACQPKSDQEQVAKPAQTDQEQKPVIKPKTPITESALDAKTCLTLNKTMQDIDHSSKIEAIYAIQKQLKACLPTASNTEVIDLLKSYQTMYRRFLGVNDYLDDAVLFEVAETLEQGNKVSSEHLKSMSLRNQYLIQLIEQGADVSLLHIGEGLFIFHHDLTVMANLFTPYLPKAQATFIQRMAKDNQDIF